MLSLVWAQAKPRMAKCLLLGSRLHIHFGDELFPLESEIILRLGPILIWRSLHKRDRNCRFSCNPYEGL